MRMVAAAAVLVAALVMGVAAPTPAAPSPSSGVQAFVLTKTSVALADVSAGRVLLVRPLTLTGAVKIIHSAGMVLVQGQRTVAVLDDRTLEQIGTVASPDPIADIAAAGGLLAVGTGSRLQVYALGPRGQARVTASFALQKAADAVVIRDGVAYVLDDVIQPLFVYRIDLRHLGPRRVATLQWYGANTHLTDQHVTDRWYVLESYSVMTGAGQALRVLPLQPPLQFAATYGLWDADRDRSGNVQAAFIRSFRMDGFTLYGLATEAGRLHLVRMGVGPDAGAARRRTDLGPDPGWRSGTIDIAGRSLIVASAGELLTFALPAGEAAPSSRVRLSSGVVSFGLKTGTH